MWLRGIERGGWPRLTRCRHFEIGKAVVLRGECGHSQLASIGSDREQVPANSGWFDIRVQAEKVYGIKLLL